MKAKEIEEKFKTEIEEADWSMLKDHGKRGAIIVVSSKVGLVNAAVALAIDDAISVKLWQETKLIGQATEEQMDLWEQTPYQKLARFLIVQPYVLIELIGDGQTA